MYSIDKYNGVNRMHLQLCNLVGELWFYKTYNNYILRVFYRIKILTILLLRCKAFFFIDVDKSAI